MPWHSIQCRLLYACFGVIMFLMQKSASSEGRRRAHLRIKSPPGSLNWSVLMKGTKPHDPRKLGYLTVDDKINSCAGLLGDVLALIYTSAAGERTRGRNPRARAGRRPAALQRCVKLGYHFYSPPPHILCRAKTRVAEAGPMESVARSCPSWG